MAALASEHGTASRTSINVTLPNADGTSRSNHPHGVMLTHDQAQKLIAARIIERAWMSFRDRQMFKLLKHAVCAAEHSLTYEILRKVSPQEADFFRDPSTNIRVRFRFGGSEFPPLVYFKMFTHTNGKGLKYITGKKVIKPSDQSARDALQLMGNRRYLDLMIRDAVHQEQFQISDEVDVTTLKEYMKYLSHLDETPAVMGGKENLWRRLTLDVLPRTTVFYDVLDFVYSKHLSPRLQSDIPMLLSRPVTQEVQLEHIRVISEVRSPEPPPIIKYKHSAALQQPASESARRSKRARQRALKMRKAYTEGDSKEATFLTQGTEDVSLGEMGEGDEWEQEADRLYEWTQELTYDDIATPRLPSFVES